jgi:hypothetical protein
LFPMIFVLVMTMWALGKLTIANFQASKGVDIQFFNGVAASALILLAIYLAITALLKLRIERGRRLIPDLPAAGD